MKKIYRFASSNIGIIILFFGYPLLFGSFFNGSHIDQTIAATIGNFIGGLIPPLLLMLLLRSDYKWGERKQVTNWLLFAYCFQLIARIPGMQTPIGILSIIIFVVWFFRTIIKSFTKKKVTTIQ